jgi:hypothetical protein
MFRAEPWASELSGSIHSTVGDGAGSCADAGTAEHAATTAIAVSHALLIVTALPS